MNSYKAKFVYKSDNYSLIRIENPFHEELSINLQITKDLIGFKTGFENKLFLKIENTSNQKTAEVLGYLKDCENLSTPEMIKGVIDNPQWLLKTLHELSSAILDNN